jgi:hypothetical protein
MLSSSKTLELESTIWFIGVEMVQSAGLNLPDARSKGARNLFSWGRG